jgi:hypothetical protein
VARTTPARGSFDISWFTGSMLSPRALAHRLLEYFPSEEPVSVEKLALRSGVDRDSVERALFVLLGEKKVRAVAATPQQEAATPQQEEEDEAFFELVRSTPPKS